MLESRAKLSHRPARERSHAVADLCALVCLNLLAACGGGGEETPHRERPAFRAFQEQCQRSRQSCGPEGLCEQRCAEVDAEQGGCEPSCEPHPCLSNDWTHGACIMCCAGQAHSAPDALSRCQKKCGALYEL